MTPPSDSTVPPEDARAARAHRLRRILVGFAVAAGLSALVVFAAHLRQRARAPLAEGPKERPSIIFVLVDTLRPDYLGAYGFAGDVSPGLDAFAREAVLFERAFAQAPWTKPSIASLFTSLHPETHRVLTHRGRYGDAAGVAPTTDALADEATTLAESLHAAGYATAAFVANPWLLAEHGFGQGFEVYRGPDAMPIPAHRLLRLAREWLATRDAKHPFFLYLHFMDVHGPYRAPKADYEAVRQSPTLGPSRPMSEAERARLRTYLLRAPWAQSDQAVDVREWRARYAAGVRVLDRQLGRFLEELEKSGALDRSIVVVTSDHGEELADRGGWDHGHGLDDHQLHVPLLVRLPGGALGGRRVSDVVSLVDVMPTLLAWAGVPVPASAQGRDLTPVMRGDATEERPTFAGGVKWNPELRSVRTAEWKLIEDGRSGTARLFDLARDPEERTDVAATRPDVATELASKLAEHRRKLAAAPSLAPAKVEVSGDMQKRLEALGYAH